MSDENAKHAEALVETARQHAAAEALEDYLRRGRRFEHVETDTLKDRWISEITLFLRSLGERNPLDMNDAEAELGLRQVTVPYDLVPQTEGGIQEEIMRKTNDPENRARLRSHLREIFARRKDYH